MTEQHKYYTLTEDVKTLIQYIQEQAIDHSVVEAANRLNWAIKKDLKNCGIPVTPIKESKDSFEEEKLQYAEDSRAHEKPTTFNPEYYSGLNWRDAEHLIGKTVECTNNPDAGWKVGKLQIATRPGEFFNVDTGNRRQYFYDYYAYLRTCKETHQEERAKAWADWWEKEVLAKI